MKVICMECQAELSVGAEACDKCGSKDIVSGDIEADESGCIHCDCGSKEFRRTMHLNMNPVYLSTLECVSCKKTVHQKTYYESPYM